MIDVTEEIKMIRAEGKYFPFSNSYFINDRLKILIDSGAGEKSLKPLADKGIDILINSHYHVDHTLNNNMFKNSKIYAHHLDTPAIKSIRYFKLFTGIDERSPYYKRSKVDITLNDGDIIDSGNVKLKVIHTPGYTPGHLCFYCEEESVLISGDIDLSSFGPSYPNYMSDIDDFIISIKRIIELNPSIILSGFGEIIRDNIKERLIEYLNKIYEREKRILKTLNRPKSIEEIASEKLIYNKHPDNWFVITEKIMVEKHLNRMLKNGIISFKNGKYKSI